MTSPSPPPQRRRFGDFEADLRSGELWRNGRRVRLQDKPFQLLAGLLEVPGEVVTREELHRRLWPEASFLDFDHGLHTAVNKLREALRDSAAHPRYVETLPRRGYRLLVTVAATAPAETQPDTAPASGTAAAPVTPLPEAAPALARSARQPWGALLVLLAALAAGALLAGRFDAGRGPGGAVRLAVLPFASAGGVSGDEAWSGGLTEELTTHLGRLAPDHLVVIAPGSARAAAASARDLGTIGRTLDADYLLEGSVRQAARPGSGRLRVSVRLVRVRDRASLWAETYDRSAGDLFALQDDIAARVAIALLPGEPRLLARAATTSTAAYEAYLRGLHDLGRQTPEGLEASLGHLQRAIRLDSGFAPAYAALARVHTSTYFLGSAPPDAAFPRALAAAEAALAHLEPLPEAHAVLAAARLFYQWNVEAAEAEFRRALALSPGDAYSWAGLALLLTASGRHGEALAAGRRSLALDPLTSPMRTDLGWALLFARDYEGALAECGRVLRRLPAYGPAARCRWLALVRLGRGREALAAARQSLLLSGVPAGALASLDRLGTAAALRRALQLRIALMRQARPGTSPYFLAQELAELGDRDAALSELRRAIERREGRVLFARVDPRFDALRGDPELESLLGRLRPRG